MKRKTISKKKKKRISQDGAKAAFKKRKLKKNIV